MPSQNTQRTRAYSTKFQALLKKNIREHLQHSLILRFSDGIISLTPSLHTQPRPQNPTEHMTRIYLMIGLICIQSTHMIILLGNGTPFLRRTAAQYSSVLQIDSTTSVPSAGCRTSIGYKQRAIPWAQTPCNLTLGLSIFCMALVKMPCLTRGRHHLLWSIPS